jgi:hypothetical protein
MFAFRFNQEILMSLSAMINRDELVCDIRKLASVARPTAEFVIILHRSIRSSLLFHLKRKAR